MNTTKRSTVRNVVKIKESDDRIDEIESKRARTDTAPEGHTEKSMEVINANHEQMLQKLVHDAVEARDIVRLRKLLKHKPKLDSYICCYLLWMVIEDEDTEIATMLVRAGTNVRGRNVKDADRPTLLHALVKKIDNPKKLELIRLMLDYGAGINRTDQRGYTILDYAISILTDPLEIFREFYLERGGQIDSNSLSIIAAKTNYVEYLSMFVRGNNSQSRTVLRKKNRAAEAIRLLADSRGDENSSLPAVQWLLDCKPYIKILSKGALVSAVLQNKIELVKLLIQYGVDVNKKDSLLCDAVRHTNSDMVDLLIRSGMNIHSCVHYARSMGSKKIYPIHIACRVHADKNIQLLLLLGVDVTVVDGNGQTPFCTIRNHSVLSNAHCIMIKHFVLLLERESKIHENDFKLINQELHMFEFFKDCCTEMKKMVATKILDDFSYYSFLSQNINDVVWSIQNEKFLYNLSQYQYKNLFPLYSNDIEWVIGNALEQRAILVKKEEAVD